MKLASLTVLAGISLGVLATSASSQEKLVVSVWGGPWQQMVAETIGDRFTEQTGVEVEYVTGGTVDRLNKARLSKDDPETDIVFTTAHVGWLYASGDLFEKLDLTRLSNAPDMLDEAKQSPYQMALWTYVYTIAYRTDMIPEDIDFDTWRDLWDPRLAGTIALPDFDPSHIIAVSAVLSGADPANWEKGQELLLELKPNINSFFATGAVSQEKIISGETPVQVALSGHALDSIEEGHSIKVVVPKEGAVLGFDVVAINKGTDKLDAAYKFIDVAISPEAQAEAIAFLKLGPMNSKTEVESKYAEMPGIITNAEQLRSNAIVLDEKLRAEKMSEWKAWFNENIIAR